MIKFLNKTEKFGLTLQVLMLFIHLRLRRSSTMGPKKIVAVMMIGQTMSLIFNFRNRNDKSKSIHDLFE